MGIAVADHQHRRSQGGCQFFFRRNLQGKCVRAPPGHEVHPQPEQQSIFRTVFAGWVRFRGVFRRSLRATTKKGRQLFGKKKVHPRQNPVSGPLKRMGIKLGQTWDREWEWK